jgi:hypothetical protein
MQAIFAITVMAWNIALFPDEEHAQVQGMLLESLPPQLSGEDVGVLLSTIDTLIARKLLLYLLSARLTIPLVCCPIKSFRRASRCGEAMVRRQKSERRAGSASRGM